MSRVAFSNVDRRKSFELWNFQKWKPIATGGEDDLSSPFWLFLSAVVLLLVTGKHLVLDLFGMKNMTFPASLVSKNLWAQTLGRLWVLKEQPTSFVEVEDGKFVQIALKNGSVDVILPEGGLRVAGWTSSCLCLRRPPCRKLL